MEAVLSLIAALLLPLLLVEILLFGKAPMFLFHRLQGDFNRRRSDAVGVAQPRMKPKASIRFDGFNCILFEPRLQGRMTFNLINDFFGFTTGFFD